MSLHQEAGSCLRFIPTTSHHWGQGPAKVFHHKNKFRNGNFAILTRNFAGIWFLFYLIFFSLGEAGSDEKTPCPLLAKRYPPAKLMAAAEKKPLWALSWALSWAYRRSDVCAIQHPKRRFQNPFYDHGVPKRRTEEVLCHKSKKKVTKNVLSAWFNFLKKTGNALSIYQALWHYELLQKCTRKKKGKKERRKENGKQKKIRNCENASSVCSWTQVS